MGKILIFLAVLAFLGACDAVDTILPSSNTYRVNAQVNNIPLDERSFVSFNDKITPFFEESISNDPDVTAIVVFLRDSKGEIAGWKVRYSLDDDFEDDEIAVSVKNFENLPSFPMPEDLDIGRYTMVSQIMCGKDILQRNERAFFYLGKTDFSFVDINVHLPGVTDNSQVIPRGMVVVLEAELDFDSRLDPYIVWYYGRRKISEGRFSQGANLLFWTAPEQSGFFDIRAEVFPVHSLDDLAGFQREISLLVSSNKTTDINLVKENIPQLLHWYVLDGNLNDSKMAASSEQALKPVSNSDIIWMPVNGTYGLATGSENIVALPKVTSLNNGQENWQALFRFKPLDDGVISYVNFGSSSDIYMTLSVKNQNLILTLVSSSYNNNKAVSQEIRLPSQDAFVTAGINFTISPELLTATINVLQDSFEQRELASSISIEAEMPNDFQILLGHKKEDNNGDNGDLNTRHSFTALWDEYALYNTPPMEIIAAEVKQAFNFEQPESYDDSLD